MLSIVGRTDGAYVLLASAEVNEMASNISIIVFIAALCLTAGTFAGTAIMTAEQAEPEETEETEIEFELPGPFTATFDPGMTGTGFDAEIADGFDADLIEKGDSFAFTVEFGSIYNGSVSVIRGSGSPEVLEADDDGVYVVDDVRSDITIVISAPLKTFTITFIMTPGIINVEPVYVVDYGTTGFQFNPKLEPGYVGIGVTWPAGIGYSDNYSSSNRVCTITSPITADLVIRLMTNPV